MKIRLAGGLPGDEPAARLASLAAVEIDAHAETGGGRAAVDGVKRDTHFAIPDLLARVDAGLHAKAGIPKPATLGEGLHAVDIQVHPFGLGGDFKLFIAGDAVEVAADEDFGHVPIPELVGFRGT